MQSSLRARQGMELLNSPPHAGSTTLRTGPGRLVPVIVQWHFRQPASQHLERAFASMHVPNFFVEMKGQRMRRRAVFVVQESKSKHSGGRRHGCLQAACGQPGPEVEKAKSGSVVIRDK